MSSLAPSGLESALAYLPIDRQIALARGEQLPERTYGAALFADISGFTALADALVQALGPQRGAEELTRQLDAVYGALIAEVDRYGGSVIGFSGDAITCWLDQDDGRRATAAGLAMQRAMRQIAPVPGLPPALMTLGLKAAIATGPVRRFVVGDRTIQSIDVLAGQTLDRLALAEHAAEKGEVVLDPDTASQLQALVDVQAWREADGRRYALVAGLTFPVEQALWSDPVTLDETLVRPWLLPAVYARIRSGQAAFLAELRPVVALFLRFEGIDYESDPAAGQKLDAYVRWVQQILARVEGTLIQVTIGDKGSYLYAALGAPVAHDDDATRAVAAAMTLCAPPPELGFIAPPQIGISRGRMRTGPYGGPTRRTYGVLGDEVNVAARLMQAAAGGQILVTARVVEATRGALGFVPLAPVAVKGKSEPLEIFTLPHHPPRPGGQSYGGASALPLVGRESELEQIDRAFEDVLRGNGHLLALVGEAGVGKSRLVTEIVRHATTQGFAVHLGEAQSYGTNAVYLAWHAIWRDFFSVEPDVSAEAQVAQLEAALTQLDPASLPRLPLLGTVLNVPVPDNDLTRTLDARQRKDLLETVLVACLRARAQSIPLLFVLEDCHWLDELSLDLLQAVARSVTDLPVLVVLAHRPLEPSDAARAPLDRIVGLPHAHRLILDDFTPEQAAQLIGLKLTQLGEGAEDVPVTTVERITARAGGNPFYIEELLNYLHDRHLDPRDPHVLEQSDLPESLHSLILSRVDHLDERQQVVLKVASIVGRQFGVAWLWGVYPDLGQPSVVKTDLDRLRHLDITPLDRPEPDLHYLFKHVVTQQVVYDSQPHAIRAQFHQNLARFLEATYPDRREQYLDLLAYHYGRTDNLAKQRQYFREAGEHAARRYASAQAVGYFTQALAVTPEHDAPSRFELVLARARAFEAQSAWTLQAADLDALTALAEHLDDRQRAETLLLRAAHRIAVSDFPSAIEAARQAVDRAQAAGSDAHAARAYMIWGRAHFVRERYAEAREPLERALVLARRAGAREVEARTLNVLGVLAEDQGDYPRARDLFEQALGVYRDLGDLFFESVELNNLGLVASIQGALATAQAYLERAHQLAQMTGHRRIQETVPANLGDIAYYQGQYALARERYERSLPASHELGDIRYEVHNLTHLSLIASAQGDHARALELGEAALAVARPIGQPRSQAYAYLTLGHAYLGLGRLDEATAAYQQSATIRREIGQPHLAVESVAGLARVALARGDTPTALAHTEEILTSLQTRDLDGTSERFRIYLTCYHALTANRDPRAAAILERATRELGAQADAAPDDAARRALLENVPWHRELWALAH